MKVALIISGYLRSFYVNIPTIKNKILNNFEKVDVYLHITKNEDEDDKYLNINFNDELSYVKNMLNPICVITEPNFEFSKNNKENNLLNTWFKYYKLNLVKKENEKILGKYDLVIKYRPDLNLNSDKIFPNKIDENCVYIPELSVVDVEKLTNKTDKYICDIFAYGDSDVMDNYFNFFINLKKLSLNYGFISETLLYEYLIQNEINHKLIDVNYSVILSSCNVFAICGDSGSGKTTLGNALKKYFSNSFMLECDRYHKWERGNENWKKLTHLNPEANYITKMSNDIFDLKIGKSIYQVDYDHKTGKFTDKEKIDSSDNLIVCGLHSLYTDNNSIYNLKIFIDTDVKLKTKWKIKRDIKKRGYNLSEVLTQIEKRNKDYTEYIYPQKELSDIVINFYSEEEINYDLDNENKLSLIILVNRKYNLINILNTLSKYKIPFKLNSSNLIFNEIKFKEYTNCNLTNSNEPFNNFYDYIIFFILNLNKL
jgi:uridine kinase